MATIVETESSKMECLSEYLEKVLKYGGRAMSCLERLKEEYEEDDDEDDEEYEEVKKSKKKRSMKDRDEYSRYY